MRHFVLSSLLLGGLFSSNVFAQQTEALNYNLVNVQAEATRQVSNDEMHAVLYIEKSNKQPSELASQMTQLMNQAIATLEHSVHHRGFSRCHKHVLPCSSTLELVDDAPVYSDTIVARYRHLPPEIPPVPHSHLECLARQDYFATHVHVIPQVQTGLC